jgi:hypothetical protein
VASLPAVYLGWHLHLGNGKRLYGELVEFVFENYASVNAGKLDYLFFFRLGLTPRTGGSSTAGRC